ncbi:MAG: hypothetical protein PHV02_07200 [Rhodocyclaceae bacterium]|nr:hypothetical protein [Rhodocyclaceae bacterium]
MSIPFDTLDYAKKLEDAGLPAAQAAAQSKVLADVLSKAVAFPGDLVSLERSLSAKIESTELKLENKLAVIAGDISLSRWMTTTLIAINVAILVKLFVQAP